MTENTAAKCPLITEANMATLPPALRNAEGIEDRFSSMYWYLRSKISIRSPRELRALGLPCAKVPLDNSGNITQMRNIDNEISFNGIRCAVLVSEWLKGIYHLPKTHVYAWHSWAVDINVDWTLATTDTDDLTRLVILAHKHAIRVEIEPHSTRSLRLSMSPRTEAVDKSSCWATTHPSVATLAGRIQDVVQGK